MHKNMKLFLVIFFTLFLLLCMRKYFSENSSGFFSGRDNILAFAGGYSITLEDYLHEKDKFAPFYNEKSKIDKQYLLDLLINDTVLLKEAERQALNRDKSFLKGIEYYWRQSLVEALLKRKNAEIRGNIRISEEEIRKFYNSLNKEYYFRSVELSAKKSELPPGLPEKAEDYLKSHPELIRHDSGFYWTDLKAMEPVYRNYFLNKEIQAGKTLLLDIKDSCTLVFIQKEQPKTPGENFETLKSELETILREDKERDALEAWLETLRKNIAVVINQELYSKM